MSENIHSLLEIIGRELHPNIKVTIYTYDDVWNVDLIFGSIEMCIQYDESKPIRLHNGRWQMIEMDWNCCDDPVYTYEEMVTSVRWLMKFAADNSAEKN